MKAGLGRTEKLSEKSIEYWFSIVIHGFNLMIGHIGDGLFAI